MFDLIAEIKQLSKLFVVLGLGFVGLYIIFTEVATQDGVAVPHPEAYGSALPGAAPQKPASQD